MLTLGSQWKLILTRAWSVRLITIAGVLTFGDGILQSITGAGTATIGLAVLASLFNVGAFVARVVVQQNLPDV